MARVYPQLELAGSSSKAELTLFAELARQLPNDYHVFHSVAWMVRRGHSEVHGEVDFVIAHPSNGILVLEVKGGRLHGEWGAKQWTSIDAHNRSHATTNPFFQADKAMWAMCEALATSPRTSAFSYPPIRRAVAFPDMLAGDIELGPNADRSMVIDSSSLNGLQVAVERALGRTGGPVTITPDAMTALQRLLSPVVEITRPGLAYDVLEGEDQIMRLTEAQLSLLQFLQHHSQAVINGCAGSGKTVLAIEKAARLAEDGFDVLLTCFNRNLATWMRSVLAARPQPVQDRITVRHYHDLAVELCREAGVPTQVEHATQAYWDDGLAADLLTAIPQLERRFNAIVVDEGQDFLASWWITLQELLDRPNGVFYIFQDEQQAIYHRERDLPVATAPFTLNTNVRSTAAIHDHVARYFDGTPKPVSTGPQGRTVEFVEKGNRTDSEAVRRVLTRLLGEEGLQPSQVAVLTPHGTNRSTLLDGAELAGVRLTRSLTRGPREVLVSSIHAFKGLESDVVILAETESLARRDDARMLTYVALSRAKHHLIVIGELPEPAG